MSRFHLALARNDTVPTKTFMNTRPAEAVLRDGSICRINGKVWIPNLCMALQLKLVVVAHCAEGGRRGFYSTYSALKERYYWRSMSDDCKEFVKMGIHCILSKSGSKIPRPLSFAIHGKLSNYVLHFDYLYMGASALGTKYILVIKDDVSSYAWLCTSTAANAEHTAEELTKWVKTFTLPKVWVSDQGSHFKNVLIHELAKVYDIRHSFTVAYSPWVIGNVERVMRTVLATCGALLSELKLAPQDWPLVVGMLMTIINEAPLKRLGENSDGTYRCPLQAMTGIKPARTQLTVDNSAYEGSFKELKLARAYQLLNINTIQSAIDEMHKDVEKAVSRNRAKNIKQHNKNTNIMSHHFQMGDFVVARVSSNKKKGHKLMFKWVGPKRVTGIMSDLVYEVSSLVDGSAEKVHASRMQLYRKDLDGKEVSQELREQAQHSETKYEVVEKLVDIGEASDGIVIQVQWAGLPEKCDWTWNKVQDLHEEIPEEVVSFLGNTSKKSWQKRRRKNCESIFDTLY